MPHACRFALFACLTLSAPASAGDITHGPILGGVTAHSIRVWARTVGPGEFFVEYGLAPNRLTNRSAVVRTSLDHDGAGWTQLDGLEPDTRYHYRVVNGRPDAPAKGPVAPERAGAFRTLPDGKRLVDAEHNPRGLFNLQFEFACGNNQTPGQGGGSENVAFRTMHERLKDRIHFSILNGDWLYEEARDFTPDAWRKQVAAGEAETPRAVRIAPTLVGVWQNYKNYLEHSPNLARYHRDMPTFFIFDDHEMLNDVWGAGTPGLRDRRAVFRDIGQQAWYDYLGWSNPVGFQQPIQFGRARLAAGSQELTDPEADFTRLDPRQTANLHVHWGGPTAGVNDNKLDGVGGDPNAGVYRIVNVLDRHRLKIEPAPPATGEVSYSIGRRSYYKFKLANCEFFCLDTRTHREMHDTKRPDRPGLSMLGGEQKAWLLAGLKASDADFLFVVSSVNFMVPHVGGGAVRADNKDDAWTVFLDEREQLIQAFDALGKPVCVLTGDLHNSFAIKITDRVWEFASGPHNSNNHWASDEGGRPATGKFQYGPRACDIRWSTWFKNDIPREALVHPTYCVVQVNNVFNNPPALGQTRWIAYERPQLVFQYYDGRTGELRYAESLVAAPR